MAIVLNSALGEVPLRVSVEPVYWKDTVQKRHQARVDRLMPPFRADARARLATVLADVLYYVTPARRQIVRTPSELEGHAILGASIQNAQITTPNALNITQNTP